MSTNNADLTNGTDFDPNLEDGFRIEFYNTKTISTLNIYNVCCCKLNNTVSPSNTNSN